MVGYVLVGIVVGVVVGLGAGLFSAWSERRSISLIDTLIIDTCIICSDERSIAFSLPSSDSIVLFSMSTLLSRFLTDSALSGV